MFAKLPYLFLCRCHNGIAMIAAIIDILIQKVKESKTQCHTIRVYINIY